MSATHLGAFAAASLLLAITPGPGVLFIVARTLADGRRAGLADGALAPRLAGGLILGRWMAALVYVALGVYAAWP
jgi:threonine/homoserine/homoserine lactone efflux protein